MMRAAVLAVLLVPAAVIGLDPPLVMAGSHLTEGAFVTTWNVTASPYTISIPVRVHTGGTLTMDWGDGIITPVTTNGMVSHTYSASGEYQVSMTDDLSRIILGNNGATASKLVSIDQWGDIEWSSMKDAFLGASNMEYRATDAPDLSGVISMADMFYNAGSFNGYISVWNVSSVENMSYMFGNAGSFNQPLNDWDVSAVADMNYMFSDASSFNQPLNDWNTSSVADMHGMFFDATNFNQPLNDWDVSKVTNMISMFTDTTNFNGNISSWNVSSVIHMNNMFARATSFNQPLNNWNVSKVTDMANMFDGATSFNQPLNNWDVSKVANMRSMFNNASVFNGDISGWDVSQVGFMFDMFSGADAFDQNLGNWYVVPADLMYDAATESLFVITAIKAQNSVLDGHFPNYGIGTGDDSDLFSMTDSNLVFKDTPSAGNYTVTVTAPGGDFGTGNHRILEVTVIGQGNQSPVVTASGSADVYEGSVGRLTGTVSGPDTTDHLTYMWTHNDDTSSLGITITNNTALSTTFKVAGDVTTDTPVTFTLTVNDETSSPVTGTVVVNIQDSSGAFIATWETGAQQKTVTFTVSGTNPIIDWGDGSERTSPTGRVGHTYAKADQYRVIVDGSVSELYHPAGTGTPELLRYVDQWGDIEWSSMQDMFRGASNMEYRATDTPDLSGVSDMDRMFYDASSFDGEISSWNVSSVTHMSGMFSGASSFDGEISSWNVSSVTNMSGMFSGASSFNQTLNDWNVFAVTYTSSMFSNAISFDQPLNNWNVSAVTDMTNMFSGATSFDRPLNNWNVSKVTDMTSMFDSASAFKGDISSWDVSSVKDTSYMFLGASSFNQSLNDWDVSAVTDDMTDMFSGATSFEQNLGEWYIVPAETAYDITDASLNVTVISAQNSILDDHDPTYGIDPDNSHDSGLFNMTGNNLMFKSTPPSARVYTVNVTAPGGDFGTNNHHVFDITVTGEDRHLPDVTAGGSADVYEGSVGRLTGTVSGPDTTDHLTYMWTHNDDTSSLGITITNNTALSTTFKVAGDVTTDTPVTFTLTVNDETSSPVTGTVVVNIQDSSGAFIATWETGAQQKTVTFTVSGTNPIIDWGDGSERTSSTSSVGHTYAEAGQYRVIVNGSVDRLYHLDGTGTPEMLRYVDQWGDIEWSSMRDMFHGASNMEYRATDTPDLSRVTTMESMFNQATSFNGDISNWNVSTVTNMRFTFADAFAFNGDISNWNVSKVTDMNSMFFTASVFNGDISNWNVSKVTDMANMFLRAFAFNGDISNWNVSAVTNMRYMFGSASVFNGDISNWNISKVTDTSSMFDGASVFNGDISNWNVSKVTDMNYMFDGATSFDQPLDRWNVSAVTDMRYMFNDASLFNQPLNDWDVSVVTDMNSMFSAASDFNGDISNWNVSAVTDMTRMFLDASKFNQPLNDWDVSAVTDMIAMFQDASKFNQPLNDWNVSAVTDMNFIFFDADDFEQNLGSWYVVPADTVYNTSDETSLVITTIAAQNSFLDRHHTPNYGIGTGGNSALFNMTGNNLMFKSTPLSARVYTVNVTAPGGDFGTNNYRVLDITVKGLDDGTLPAGAFVTTWRVTDADKTIKIPMGGQMGNYTVDWGDGTDSTTHVSDATHTYSTAGDYTVSISGDFKRIFLNGVQSSSTSEVKNAKQLRSIEQWGDMEWSSMTSAFRGASKMTYNATDTPDLTNVKSMEYMFHAARAFNGNLSSWNVSQVTNMGFMYQNARAFNGDISSWNVSKVTNMQAMFAGADAFNQPLNRWDVSQVTNMDSMFIGADAFNGDISSWNVSAVTDMNSMFNGASSFNGDISIWNVSAVTDMSSMFNGASSFNGDISRWNVSAVTDMSSMFNGASSSSFNDNISSWNVSAVTDMSSMFDGAYYFNGDISRWNVSAVTDMNNMFNGVSSFNQTLNDWDVLKVTDMSYMFSGAEVFNQPLNDWDVSKVNNTYGMFEFASSFNGNISSWNVSAVTNMNSMFSDASSFNQTLNNWNVSKVTDMSYMFLGAAAFNQPLNGWDVSKVTNTDSMFEYASSFNQPLNDWDVSKVTDMYYMFSSAAAFNQPLNNWNVSKVTDMDNMFSGAEDFNQPLNNWNVSAVTSMRNMFSGASSFEQNLGKWYVVPADTVYNTSDETSLVITTIAAQNSVLDGHSHYYGIGTGGNSTLFSMTGSNLMFKSTPLSARIYTVNVTAPEGDFGTNNHRVLDITVEGQDDSTVSADAFLTTWNVTASPYTISIPVEVHTGGTLTIDWGEGTAAVEVTTNGIHSYTYSASGEYQVSMTGDLSRIDLGATGGTPSKLASIDQWGDIEWISMQDAFRGVSNMEYHATDAPNLSRVTSMQNMFRDASSFNSNLSDWNVSTVTNMDGTFRGASDFNGDVSSWDTSSATDMRNMFQDADNFDGDISGWDVSKVTDTSSMFYKASDFNQPLNGWDVSKVTYMSSMFNDADSFNQPLNGWDVSKVTDMSFMFFGTAFFDGDLTGWNVSKVTDMSSMFDSASSFDRPLDSWDVSSVTEMNSMFASADSFNQPLNNWNVSAVTDMYAMFRSTAFFDGDISGWDVSKVTDMSRMFQDASEFNQPLNSWNVSAVTDMNSMFFHADDFEQNLGKWYVVPADTVYNTSDETSLVITTIAAQNFFLDHNHTPNYGIGTGGDFALFNMTGNNLMFKSTPLSAKVYTVNVTASGSNVFENGNNWRTLTVTVTGQEDSPLLVYAGPDQRVLDESAVTLSGTVSDSDSTDPTYLWTQNPGSPAVTLENSGTLTPAFTAPDVFSDVDLVFTLTVRDGTETVTDTVTVTVHDAEADFVITWGDTGTGINLPIRSSAGSFTVDWGDGEISKYAAVTTNKNLQHIYDIPGTYTIRISGNFSGISWQDNQSLARHLQSIDQWGDIEWTTMAGAFTSASNMIYNATDVPDLSSVTDMSHMFRSTDGFSSGDLSGWNVSGVTDMRNMFSSSSYTGDLSSWDVSSVTYMQNMFSRASSFNSDLSGWNVSAVNNMDGMFFRASSFNSDLSGWNVSSVASMQNMFLYASSFNSDLSGWNVSAVLRMNDMFSGATSFEQNLGPWYIVLDSDTISYPTQTLEIMAQNLFLGRQNPVYGLGVGGDFDLFVVDADAGTLGLDPNSDPPPNGIYQVNVTSTGIFGTANHHTVSVTVDNADPAVTPPTFDSSELNTVTGVLTIVFSETIDVTPTTSTKIHIRESGNYTGGITLSADELGTTVDGATISFTLTQSQLTTVTGLTTPELTIEPGAVQDTFGNLIDGTFDASTAVFVDATSVASRDDKPQGMAFSNDGTRMFVVGDQRNAIIEYTLSPAFNVSSAVFVPPAFSVASEDGIPTGMAFSNDGTKMFVIGDSGNNINEYTLMTAFDISTAFYNGDNERFSVSSEGSYPTDMAFSNDGAKMFVLDNTDDEINEYTLSTPFDISTATSTDVIFSVTEEEDFPLGIAFSNDGAKMFVVGGNDVNEYTLKAAFDISNATFVDATALISSGDIATSGIAFSNDGAKMFAITYFGDEIYEYTLSSVYPITLTNITLETIGAQSGDELSQITFIANATDGNSGDTLTFSLVGAPTGASINFTSGAFAWTPNEGQDGDHTITVQVNDSANASDSEDVTVTVNEVNVAPELTLIGPQSINRPLQLLFMATATDADTVNGTANTLAFSLGTGAPNGASINSTTGAFAWTPTADQVRSHTVRVQVNDGNNGSDFEDVSITVTESNVTPVLETIGTQSGDELSQITFIANATDGNSGDTLTFSLVGAPTGASINLTSGAFAWTPTEMQDGAPSITVQVSDSRGGTASETITVTVSEVNTAPVLDAITTPKGVARPDTLTFTATASDDDYRVKIADTVAFSLTGTTTLPGASITPAGNFSWMPAANQTGSYNVTVTVTDGTGLTDSQDVHITVNTQPNVAPVLTAIGSKSVNEMVLLEFNVTATDADGDSLRFSLETGAPSGASINFTSGAFAWTPTEMQDGAPSITVQVSDSRGGTASETITVTVSEVNTAPVLDAITTPKGVARPDTLTFTATASDDDYRVKIADTVAFSLTGTTTLPGASITPAGNFSWMPAANQTGSYNVTVTVTDGTGLTDSQDVHITVNTQPNVAPVLTAIGSKSVNEMVLLEFNVTATDADGDSLRFSLETGAPSGASINLTSGAFAWTPTEMQDGAPSITVQVSDSRGGTASETITVTVSEVNTAPVLDAITTPKGVARPDTLTFTATASDDDYRVKIADTVAFSLTGTTTLPGASITPAGNFSWMPAANQTGSYNVTVTVTDGTGLTDSQDVHITVNTQPNVAPVLTAIGSKSVNEMVLLEFNVTATDADGDSLRFSLETGAPSGASINFTSGAFAWTPTEMQDGAPSITVQVSDSRGGTASETITVTVSEVNTAPVLDAITTPKGVARPDTLTFTATASDDDYRVKIADTVAFSLTGTTTLPGASITPAGNFSWMPAANQTGSYNVTVTVTDGTGLTDSQDVHITVNTQPNVAPVLTAIGSKSVNEMVLLEFNVTATDADGDSLRFSLETGAPSGASINFTSGAFAWTPTEMQDGAPSITVQVSDSRGGTASETITVTVSEVNTAPVLDAITTPKGVARPDTLTFTATASDDDYRVKIADTVAFSLTGTTTLPGASITPAGNFSWMPAANQTGSYNVTVTVTDGTGLTDSQDVHITVNTQPNVAPVLTAIGSKSVNEMVLLEFNVTATDADGDSLRFSLETGAPSGASINFTSGAFAWTPTEMQDGAPSITVQVSDSRGGTASETITVTVSEVNTAPVLDAITTPKGVARPDTLTFTATASDDDYRVKIADTVAFSLTGTTTLPGASITPAGNFSWMPAANQTGSYNVTVTVTDGTGLTDSQDVTVAVTDTANTPPTVDASRKNTSSSSPSKAPAVHINALAQARIIDIPPHIAEQVASHDASDPLEPITPDGTFDLPLVINGYGYLLDDTTNTLVPQTVMTGDDSVAHITFTVYTQKDLAYFTLYLNLSDENIDYADSDTYITYKDDGTTSVTDPHGYIGSATVTVTQEDDQIPEKRTVRITIEFGEEPMGPTNMVAYMWNTDRKALFVKIIDAFEVVAVLPEPVIQAADPEPLEPDSGLPADPEPVTPDFADDAADPEPISSDTLWPDDYDEAQVLHIIRMWSGFESEFITDTQLLELLGLEDYQDVDLPDWMMTKLGVLVAKGDVTVGEFVLALQYVLTHA